MEATSVDRDRVRRTIEDIPDPELPPVTIGMLGMVHAVTAEGGRIRIELLPTFSGCPATDMIERDVVDAVSALEGVAHVQVRFRYDPPWTPDRISAEGRERLRSFGIAPPGGPIATAVRPEGRTTLPVVAREGSDSDLLVGDVPGGAARAGSAEHRQCPYCGSDDTHRESAFGPTPCRDVRFCAACQQPFEAFRSLGATPR